MSGPRRRGSKGPNRARTPARPPARPPARGPAKRPGPPPVVGKRPSRPLFLVVLALMWLGAAAGAFLGLHTGWKLIPVVCFAGIGLLYLRGAAGSYLRRPGPDPTGKK